MGRDVVALTPGQGGRGPQWTVFAADGSVPRPVSGAPEDLAGAPEGLAGLVESSVAVPGGVAGSGAPPVGQWSRSDLRGEIDRVRTLDRSGGDEVAARRIVEDTHDIRGLVGGDAVVSLEEVVALVAARHHELGGDHLDRVVEFSQALADRLDTLGTGLSIPAGATPQPGRGMLRQSADDPGPATGESRTRDVVHGDPGRKTDATAHADATAQVDGPAQAGPGFAPVAHDLQPHVEGPARAEVWIQAGGDGVKPVPDTIQGRRPERDGARRRLAWPGSRRAGDTAPTTASDSSHATSRASREAFEIRSGLRSGHRKTPGRSPGGTVSLVFLVSTATTTGWVRSGCLTRALSVHRHRKVRCGRVRGVWWGLGSGLRGGESGQLLLW